MTWIWRTSWRFAADIVWHCVFPLDAWAHRPTDRDMISHQLHPVFHETANSANCSNAPVMLCSWFYESSLRSICHDLPWFCCEFLVSGLQTWPLHDLAALVARFAVAFFIISLPVCLLRPTAFPLPQSFASMLARPQFLVFWILKCCVTSVKWRKVHKRCYSERRVHEK
jgi:hypothetical protein